MSRAMLLYAASQVALLPLFFLYLWIVPRRASLRTQWLLHRLLFCASLAIPFAFLLPVARVVSEVRPALQAAIAYGVELVLAPLGPALSSGMQSATPLAVLPSGAALLRHLQLLFLIFSTLGGFAFAFRLAAQRNLEMHLIRAGSTRRIGRTMVVTSSACSLPFSSGVLRPRLFLPAEITSNATRSIVVAHESFHIRRLHALWTLLEGLYVYVFWYNPFTHALSQGGARIRELMCDQEVTRRHSPVTYGSLLADTAERCLASRGAPGLVDGWITKGILKERVRFLLEKGVKGMRIMTRLSAMLAFAVAIGLFFSLAPWLASAHAEGAGGDQSSAGVSYDSPMMGLSPFGWNINAYRESITATWVSTTAASPVNTDFSMYIAHNGYIEYDFDSSDVTAYSTANATIEKIERTSDGYYEVTLTSRSGHRMVYANLRTVSVANSQAVRSGQILGTLAPEKAGGGGGGSMLHHEVWENGIMMTPIIVSATTMLSTDAMPREMAFFGGKLITTPPPY